ncbi:MAG: CRTAC1 family protein [Acidobacteria bacterium]|nr:CRTAC1 family protein [Acidobacteriota bacterium]
MSRPPLPAPVNGLRASGLALCMLLLAHGGLHGQETTDGETALRFMDGTGASGIQFRQFNGISGKRYLVETMGSGVCLLDYDGDDRLDVYLMQGAPTPGSQRPDPPPANALYRNLGEGRFQDVTARAGVGDEGQGQGCTVGDVDGDGDLDLYVVNFGANLLYRNNGDGTFTDITQVAGVGDSQWGSSAAFADIDSDGDLDLYVVNYVDFRYDNHKYCGDRSSNLQYYCSPKAYKAEPDVMYRNDGSGRFTDVTREAGLYNDREGKGLGVAFADVDDDGDVDIYVANDSTRNFLYRNDGKGHFRDVTMLAGVGFSEAGRPQAGMGIGFGDYDNDQALDLVVTNLSNQSNELYRNLGGGIFIDPTFRSGIGGPSMLFVGFGVAWLDLDADSDLDLFVANGHILDNVRVLSDIMTYPQRNHIFENRGGGRFREVSASAGPGLAMAEVSRGLAVGDLDGDGDLDLVLNGNGARAVLLLNETDPAGNYLRLRLRRETGDRFAVGARVLLTAGGVRQVREVVTGTSYQSQSELTLHFGLGSSTSIETLEVRWSTGRRERFTVSGVNRVLTLTEGTGDTLEGEN